MNTNNPYTNNNLRQTLLVALIFVTVLHGIAYIWRDIPIYETILWWLVSVSGTTLIILFAHYKGTRVRKILSSQLQDTRQYSQHQTILASLSRGFAVTQNEEEICKELALRLQEVPGFDYVAVYLIDPKTNNRILKAGFGKKEDPDTFVLPPGKGLCERAILKGKLAYSPDVNAEKKYIPGLGQGSEVDVPIQYRDKIVGVLVAENRQINAFTEDDFSLLTSAADQAALALQIARWLTAEKNRRREAEILRNATLAVSSDLELDLVLDQILTQLKEVVPFDSACIFLWEGEFLHARAARDLPSPEEVIDQFFPTDNELFQLVLNTRQPVILGDIRDDPRFLGWGGTHAMRSWMGIPLKAGEDIIGYLTLDSFQLNAYDEAKANLSQIFANQASVVIQNAKLYASAKNMAEKLVVLHEAGQKIISASFDPEKTYKAIHEAASQLMPCEAFCITIYDEANNEVEAAYLVDRNGQAPPIRIPAERGLSGYVISTGEPLLVQDYYESEIMKEIDVQHFGSAEHIRAFIAVPMRLGSKIVGILSSQSYQPHKYTSDDQKMLEMLAGHAAIALNNASLFKKMQYMAVTDDLTGVFNRRHFYEIASQEFSRSRRYKHPLSVIMLDLDYFKNINDLHGHNFGDLALKQIAQNIQKNIRDSDTLGRYGGDEFCILLPITDLQQALDLAERLRIIIGETPIHIRGTTFHTTMSVGVSSLSETVTDLSHLLISSDMALYEAKTAGRNCVRSTDFPLP